MHTCIHTYVHDHLHTLVRRCTDTLIPTRFFSLAHCDWSLAGLASSTTAWRHKSRGAWRSIALRVTIYLVGGSKSVGFQNRWSFPVNALTADQNSSLPLGDQPRGRFRRLESPRKRGLPNWPERSMCDEFESGGVWAETTQGLHLHIVRDLLMGQWWLWAQVGQRFIQGLGRQDAPFHEEALNHGWPMFSVIMPYPNLSSPDDIFQDAP